MDIQGATVAGTSVHQTIIAADDNPALANTTEVETGSTVNGFFAVVEVVGTSSAALTNFYVIFWKNPGGNLANIVPNTVGSNDNKRFVIHQEMVMLQQQTNSNPRTVFKGVIKIPRGYRRMGPNDVINISLLSPGITTNFCYEIHFKEFR